MSSHQDFQPLVVTPFELCRYDLNDSRRFTFSTDIAKRLSNNHAIVEKLRKSGLPENSFVFGGSLRAALLGYNDYKGDLDIVVNLAGSEYDDNLPANRDEILLTKYAHRMLKEMGLFDKADIQTISKPLLYGDRYYIMAKVPFEGREIHFNFGHDDDFQNRKQMTPESIVKEATESISGIAMTKDGEALICYGALMPDLVTGTFRPRSQTAFNNDARRAQLERSMGGRPLRWFEHSPQRSP